jgi:hypothetical protein
MKTLVQWSFAVAVLAVVLAACGQQPGSVTPPTPPPTTTPPSPTPPSTDALPPIQTPLPSATTPVGDAIGDPMTTTLDATGGTAPSPDGRLALVVPARALSASTNVSVGLAVNLAPGGFGLGYRVALSDPKTGAQVIPAQPLSLEFTLSDAEMSDAETGVDNLTVANQAPDGRWQFSVDATATPLGAGGNPGVVRPQGGNGGAKLSAKLSKGGAYAPAVRYKLSPSSASVRINDRLTLTVAKFNAEGTGTDRYWSPVDVTQLTASNWAVNGVANGNDTLGRLLEEVDPKQRGFRAPAKKPSPNQVRVSVQITDAGTTRTLYSRIRIEDSQGWYNTYSYVNYYDTFQRTRFSASLQVEGSAQAKFNAVDLIPVAPNSIAGFGGLSALGELDPSSQATATMSVKYSSVETEDCTSPNGEARIRVRRITYDFTATGTPEQVPATGGMAVKIGMDGTIDPAISGLGFMLELKGTVNFSNVSTGECAKLPEPITKSGPGAVYFSGKLTFKGSLKPNGPDRLRGMDTTFVDFAFPTGPVSVPFDVFVAQPKLILTSVIDYYFPYTPKKF